MILFKMQGIRMNLQLHLPLIEKLPMERGSTLLACRQAPLVRKPSQKKKLSMERGGIGVSSRQAH